MATLDPLGRNQRRMIIPSHRVSSFFGLNTLLSDIYSMPPGFSPDSLNWMHGDEKDCLILRRGTALLGKTRSNLTSGVNGLGVATRNNGVQVPFFAAGTKLKYYDSATDDTVEVVDARTGSGDIIPAGAGGDILSVSPYQNLAGAFCYVTSPNSQGWKIHAASPTHAVAQGLTDYRGFTKFGQSRALLFNRKSSSNGAVDKSGLYMSYVDKVSLANYTQVTGESVGSLGSKTYTHNLVQATGVRTVMQIVVTATVAAGTETFLDDGNGNLVSNFGGTGTVNYATGAISVTFSDTTTGAVTCSYYYEDSTSKGVLDFSIDMTGTGGTRVPGSGRYFSQFDGGGPLNSVYPLADVFYSFHTIKTWQTRIPTDDSDSGTTPPSNLPFREKMGVTNPISAFGGTDGIYYINNANPNRPEVYILRLYTGATSANIAAPKLLSAQLNLSQFVFDKAVIFEWGNYVLLALQQMRNGQADSFNSRMLVYNKKTGGWDMLDYPASGLAEYLGTLISGDPLTDNVFTLFSGFDDDGSIIPNYWTSGYDNLGFPGVKKTRRMVIGGLIQKSQQIKVSVSLDGGDFVNVFTIDGAGSYVDTGKTIAVGSNVMGSKIAGGGTTVYANPFEVEFPFETDRYVYARIRFEAISGGYAQINFYDFKWTVIKGFRVVPPREPLG